MAAVRVPTRDEYLAFDGAHCHAIWMRLDEDRACPACGRSKFEVLRWTRRVPNQLAHPGAPPYMGWLAAFHGHHDHGSNSYTRTGAPQVARTPRFAETIICDQCNSADGLAKRRLRLPAAWSFSPHEIGRFVTARPHDRHVIDFDVAASIYRAQAAYAR